MNNKQKIAFLLGSFDPIHIGHICMATETLNQKLADTVVFVPAFQNPWKSKSVDFWQRCDMVELATNNLNDCVVSDVECQTNPPHYSYETLKLLKEEFSNYELYLIVGTDVSPEIKNWYKGDWILENFKLITIARPGFDNTKADIHKYLNISSTEIRQMYRDGKQVYPLVPKIVDNFIKKYKVYE